MEVLFSRPLVVLFHQILAPAWANVIMNAAKPELAAPKTVSTKSGAIKSVAHKRSGQVAFVTGSYEDDAEKVYTLGVSPSLVSRYCEGYSRVVQNPSFLSNS